MKAVISNRIYLAAPPGGFDAIKKALTYKIEIKNAGRGGKSTAVEIIRNFKVLPKNILSIPQGRSDLIPEGYEIIDKRVINEMPFPIPAYSLYDDQQAVYDEVDDTCFINANPGWGKTFTALHLARKLGQKTLIITHTTMLRDQWIEEIQKLFNMEVGIIGSGYYDIDHAIVVGNIQTVTKHAQILSKEFGTVIMDEAHHCPATTFTVIIDAMYARYRIGLSGTMIRKDGKHVVLRDYFGPKIYIPEQSNTLSPLVKIIKAPFQLTPGEIWVKKVNNLLYDPEYQDYIAAIATSQIMLGHSVLIVADRVEFLTRIKELIGEKCLLVTGSASFEERKAAIEQLESGEAACLAGSRQIFAEGISVNILSCLILAGPISQETLLEQLIGRIQRLHPRKLLPGLHPVVFDINLSGYADKKQNNIRLGFYLKKGWQIQNL